MNIYQALNKLPVRKQLYFQYKFPDIKYNQQKLIESEEELLRKARLKTMNSYYKWEKTEEYKKLVNLYLQSRLSNDLLDTYLQVSEQAKQGDEKSVRLMLQLTDTINKNAKEASKYFENIGKKEKDDDLGLI